MIVADETFDGTWPYAPQFFSGNGFQQHYVDEGASRHRRDLCLRARGAHLGLSVPALHSAALEAGARGRSGSHGLRQERDAAGSQLQHPGALREPGGAAAEPGPARRDAGDAGLGRADRIALRLSTSGAGEASGRDEHDGGRPAPARDAERARLPLVPVGAQRGLRADDHESVGDDSVRDEAGRLRTYRPCGRDLGARVRLALSHTGRLHRGASVPAEHRGPGDYEVLQRESEPSKAQSRRSRRSPP